MGVSIYIRVSCTILISVFVGGASADTIRSSKWKFAMDMIVCGVLP